MIRCYSHTAFPCRLRISPRHHFPTIRQRHLSSSTAKKSGTENNVLSKRPSSSSKRILLASAVVISGGVSWYTRYWRNQQLQKLEFYDPDNPQSNNYLPRPPEDILRTVERAGLMGKPGMKSVKEELEDIREWHAERGYNGGLVLRELLQPLFEHCSDNEASQDHKMTQGAGGDDDGLTLQDYTHPNLARRECYYMYYEITPTGEIKHEIFCRGTTLTIDVWTSLTTWMEYDEELDCRVHMGFNRQATHILDDILPLMAPPGARTTVRVSGHSLGGAVAYLLAAKLKKRGYRVVEVTGVESPRLCATSESAAMLQSLLPSDTLRIENDVDPVPFLPPFGYPVGSKLYLVDSVGKAAYLPSGTQQHVATNGTSWTDSVFVNARIWEIISTRGRTHRISYVVPQIKQAFGLQND
ncbi:MAG: hypothetical protein SGILL_009340 [Bacillariaceae sp.]